MTAAAMLLLEWRLALFSFLVLPLATWISVRVGRMREETTYALQGRIAKMASAVQESLSVSGIILAHTTGRDLTVWLWIGLIERISLDQRSWE
jgi:ATP-binding cassette subfamily B protein